MKRLFDFLQANVMRGFFVILPVILTILVLGEIMTLRTGVPRL